MIKNKFNNKDTQRVIAWLLFDSY